MSPEERRAGLRSLLANRVRRRAPDVVRRLHEVDPGLKIFGVIYDEATAERLDVEARTLKGLYEGKTKALWHRHFAGVDWGMSGDAVISGFTARRRMEAGEAVYADDLDDPSIIDVEYRDVTLPALPPREDI